MQPTSMVTIIIALYNKEKWLSKAIKSTVAIKEKGAINLVWLGQLDKDKIYSLINVLDNFNLYQTSLRKKFISLVMEMRNI